MEVCIGFAPLEGGDVTSRLSRRAQQELARTAQSAVDREIAVGGDVLRSLSHSRGLAMASALGAGNEAFAGAIGCDVECVDTQRSWREIGVFLAGEAYSGDPETACRAWTLAEAWFKAFGVWPVQPLVRRALATEARQDQAVALAASVYWWWTAPCPGFLASVVWRGDGVTPQVANA